MFRVLVGLSGGVDSALAAYLLKKQGHEVIAGFMKNYISEKGNCTTYEDAKEAIKVAKFLGIKILSFDLQKEYSRKIIKYIYDGYKKGITPNPDILCNNLIKFDVFLKKALKMGFDKIAMGHYAKIKENGKKFKLLRGKDKNKDQSYFLSGLDQFQLSKSLFPIGELTKPEVRKLAKKIGLPNADRKDSQGLCFIGNIPIRKFLELKLKKKIGNICDEKGKVVGKHDGARFFTIGQRHGLNLPFKAYVTKIDVKKNIVTVGKKESESLKGKKIKIGNRHRIGEKYPSPINVKAKIRYRQELQLGKLVIKGKSANIIFQKNQRAIAPGQSVVAYVKDECIGGGVIM